MGKGNPCIRRDDRYVGVKRMTAIELSQLNKSLVKSKHTSLNASNEELEQLLLFAFMMAGALAKDYPAFMIYYTKMETN